MKKTVELFIDGACRGNPGPGGWGGILRYQSKELEFSGSHPHTTNNRMELMAAIKGLGTLKEPCRVIVTTDSEYVRKGITQWMKNWKLKNWKTANNQPVKNKDLWVELDLVLEKHEVEWHWVKGHSGHPENERADKLATSAIDVKRNTQL